jgi:hypothetical protein
MLYKYRRLHLSLDGARFNVRRANGEIFVAFFFICRRPIVVSIGLVDDHPLMIEGIITLFSRAQDLEISSTGSTARDIIDISSRFRPDVIIVDLSMSGDVYVAIA